MGHQYIQIIWSWALIIAWFMATKIFDHEFLIYWSKMQKLGMFWKIQDNCYHIGTEILKIEEKMTEKIKPKVVNPPAKILCSQYTLIDPLSHSLGHYGSWTWHIRPRVQNYLYFTFYQCVEQVLLSLQVMKMQRIIKGVHNVSSEFCRFLEGGWQL